MRETNKVINDIYVMQILYNFWHVFLSENQCIKIRAF
jgi:hypothetical protein